MAAQNDAGQNGSTLTTFYVVLGFLALAGVVVLAYVTLGAGGGEAATEPVEMSATLDTLDAQALVARAEGVSIGDPDAPVRIIEFGDYQCGACGIFAARVESRLEEEYIETGQVRFTFYDYPLTSVHEHAFLAARAARCAGAQDAYWRYHDVLFGRRADWVYSDNVVAAFIGFARDLGLDADAFAGCLRSDRFADVVTTNMRLGRVLGVRATPTVYINGRQIANPLNYAAVKRAIEEALGTQ